MTHHLLKTDGVRGVFLSIGVGMLAIGAYGLYAVLTYSPVEGHAPRGIIPITLFSVQFVLWGVMFISLVLVLPNASSSSIIPDLGFTSTQRKYVVYGSLLVGIGPIAAIVINMVVRFPFYPLFDSLHSAFMLFGTGIGLIVMGFSGKLLDTLLGERWRRAFPRMECSLEWLENSCGENHLAYLRTALVAGGIAVLLVAEAFLTEGVRFERFSRLPFGIGFVVFGFTALGLGTLVPGSGPTRTISVINYSDLEFKLVVFGILFLMVGMPILFFVSRPYDTLVLGYISRQIIRFGLLLLVLGMGSHVIQSLRKRR